MADDSKMTSPPNPEVGTTNRTDVCFVIGRPRSGTTVFRNMLETHPLVFSMGEIFNESNSNSYFHFLQQLQPRDETALLPSKSVENFVAYVRWCREKSREKRPDSRYVVLDVKYDQAHLLCVPWWGITFLPRLFSLIREQEWRVIDIHRRDSLAMFVSNHVAIGRGVYHSTDLAQDDPRRAKIRVDTDALMRHVTATAQGYRRVADHFRGYARYFKVTYEEMFYAAKDGQFSPMLLDGLATFFDLENAFDAAPKLLKLLEEDPYTYIENADEVRAILNAKATRPGS
jgi:hypothetical protein